VVLVLAVFAAACGSSGETTTSAADSVAPATTEATTTTTSAIPATTSTVPDTTTSSTLAGTIIDFFPQAGDVLSVVGVAHNDVLNVRAGPGIFNSIVDTLDPTGDTAANGIARDLGLAIWVEHNTGAEVGWSNSAYFAFAGGTDDATPEVVAVLGEVPIANSMEALGLIVAGSLASTEPVSVLVMTVAPSVGDLAEVTYDVIGLGDDSIYGYRLHIFADPVADGFSLRNVERTFLCGRGVTEDGELCI
jgi:hypothetical protein